MNHLYCGRQETCILKSIVYDFKKLKEIVKLFYRLSSYDGLLKHMAFIFYLTLIAKKVQHLLKFFHFYKPHDCKTYATLWYHIWQYIFTAALTQKLYVL